MGKSTDVHMLIPENTILDRHLDRKFGKDHRIRKGLSQYLVVLATMGALQVERREEGFNLHLLGKSDLPSIDLFHMFKIDGQDLEWAVGNSLNAEQVYAIEMTRRTLNNAATKPKYKNCIAHMERKNYDWRHYIKS